jgi:RNA polymerase-binding transcription factor DksA
MSTPKALPRPDAARLADNVISALRTSLVEALAAQVAEVAALRATIDDLAGDTDVDGVLACQVAERARLHCLEVVAEIQHAVRRIDDGTFGACERCGASVALECLEATPYARRCATCPGPTPRLIG